MADLLMREHKPDDALMYAERLLKLEPSNAGALLVRSASLALQGRRSEARMDIRRVTGSNPENIEAWLQTAELDIEEKQYAAALKILSALSGKSRDDSRALKLLAECYLAQRQPGKALERVRPVAMKSADPQVRILLASLAASAGETGLALETAQKLAADFPKNPDHHVFLAQVYLRSGQTGKAIEQFRAALELAPDNAAIGVSLAEALGAQGRNDLATGVYRESLKKSPGNPALQNGLAWRLATAGGNLTEAAEFARRALTLQPDNLSFLDTWGMIILKSGRKDEAVRVYRDIVSRDPKSVAYRTHLAAVLVELGRREAARDELSVAKRSAGSRRKPTKSGN